MTAPAKSSSLRPPTDTHLGAAPTRADRSAESWLPYVGLVALVLVSYAPLAKAAYIWDDDDYVTKNATLRTLDGLRRIWFEIGAVPQYYPLVHSSFWVEYHLWRLNPLGYHLVNVLLHGMSVLLVWRLLARLHVPGALLAAAIFAVHPVEVESVAWITERKNVLSLALALAALLSYLRFSPLEPTNGHEAESARWAWYTAALALFAGALLSKTVVATFPAVILVIVWWKCGRLGWRQVAPLTPFLALGVSLGLVTVWMEKHWVGARGAEWDFSPVDRILIAGRALWFYAAKLVWPRPLVFFYPRWHINAAEWWQYLFPLAALGTMGASWLARRQVGRGPLAAVLIFAGMLTPALGFFDVYPMRFSFVADHFQYHASVALVALAAATAATLANHLPVAGGWLAQPLCAVVIALLALMTFDRTRVYYEPEALYQDTIDRNPACTIAYTNLSGYLDSIGEYDRGLTLAREATSRFPDDTGAHNNLAAALLRQVNRAGAQPEVLAEIVKHAELALGRERNEVGVHNNLGFALAMQGKLEESAAQFSRALEIMPHNAEAHFGLAGVLTRQGQTGDALRHYESALSQNPDLAPAHLGLALLALTQGQPEVARRQLEVALRLDPQLVDAHYELAGQLAAVGDWRGAAQHYQAAVELRPGFDRALNNLGVALMNLGEVDAAIRSFSAAVQANPAYTEAQANLSAAQQVKQEPSPNSRPERNQ